MEKLYEKIVNEFDAGLIVLKNKSVIYQNKTSIKFMGELDDKINKLDPKILNFINEFELDSTSLENNVLMKPFKVNDKTFEVSLKKLDNDTILVILAHKTKESIQLDNRYEFYQKCIHEIKSPLTAILGYQELLKQGIYQTKEEILDAIESTIFQATKLNDLVMDMLKEATKSDSEIIDLNFKEVVEEVIVYLDFFIRKKDITLRKNLSDTFVTMTYKNAFELVKNLIENAIKYNHFGSVIEVTLKDDVLVVKDYGIGINEENLTKIFKRNFREKKSEIEGSGLGLWLVKHVATQYNMNISVNSKVNEFSEFIVSLK